MKTVDVLLINLTSANGKFVHPTYLNHVEEIFKEMRVDQLEVLWVHNAERKNIEALRRFLQVS